MTGRATIAALASGRPPSAVAVLRVSGPAAFAAAQALGGCLPAPRRAGLRTLRDPATGEALDEALLLAFPAPGSATGEDVVELHCHGSVAVVDAVLAALVAQPGVRLAAPGEFTRRAFDHGRLDLTQVEGLADLIEATTAAQRRQAAAQASGALSRAAGDWAARIVALRAQVEAVLDFADEGEVAALPDPAAGGALCALAAEIGSALAGAAGAERLREGLVVAIVGAPNSGKSTLLNALAGREAAIVSAVAGTTRDTIEVQAAFAGVPVTLVDTAGLRETADPVEAEGVARARARAQAADLVLHCAVDPPAGGWLGQPLLTMADRTGRPPGWQGGQLSVSALTGAGMAALRAFLADWAASAVPVGAPALVTRARQRDALAACHAALLDAMAVPDPVLQAEALRRAGHALGVLAGRADVEAVLDALFARFCIGK